MQNLNAACAWNDVALLTDQRASIFICKTMLQIPENEIAAIQDMILLDWTQTVDDSLTFTGSVQLQIGYLNQKQQRRELTAELPLQGILSESLPKEAAVRLLYGSGKSAGTCLLLETILQIERSASLQPCQVKIGDYQMEELLKLPEDWPCCQSLVTTAADLCITDSKIWQQTLYVTGLWQLTMVYENSDQPGEQLFLYQQQRPVSFPVPVPDGLQELERIVSYDRELTIQLLDDRRVLLAGSGTFYTGAAVQIQQETEFAATADTPSMAKVRKTEPAETVEALQQLAWKSQLQKRESEAETREKTAAGNQTESHTETVELIETACLSEDTSPQTAESVVDRESEPRSVINSRGSKRANLFKYMRHLNSSVQSPKTTRNFEISAAPEPVPQKEQ